MEMKKTKGFWVKEIFYYLNNPGRSFIKRYPLAYLTEVFSFIFLNVDMLFLQLPLLSNN